MTLHRNAKTTPTSRLELVRPSTFAGGHMVARAELNNVR